MNKYELLDSGVGEKLEKVGDIVVWRPDPEALWPKGLSLEKWNEAMLSFDRIDSKMDRGQKKAAFRKAGTSNTAASRLSSSRHHSSMLVFSLSKSITGNLL